MIATIIAGLVLACLVIGFVYFIVKIVKDNKRSLLYTLYINEEISKETYYKYIAKL